MIFRYYFVFFLIFLTSFAQNLFAQKDYQKTIDSLETLLPNVSNEEKVDVLNELSKAQGNLSQIPKAAEYANEALKLAEEIQYQGGIAKSYNLIATVNAYQENFEEASKYFSKSLELFESLGSEEGVIDTKYKIATFYVFYDREFETAIQYFKEAADFYEKNEDIYNQTEAIGYAGLTYDRKGEYETAIKYYLQAQALAQQNQDLEYQAAILYNIADAYIKQQNFEKAKIYLQEAIKTRETINSDPLIIAQLKFTLGKVYATLDEYPMAKLLFYSFPLIEYIIGFIYTFHILINSFLPY